MRGRTSWAALAAAGLLTLAGSAGASSVVDPLRPELLGAPLDAHEARMVRLTRWAAAHDALAQSYRPATDRHWILLPPGSPVTAPPSWAPANTRIKISRHDRPALRAAERAVVALATAPAPRSYSYAISVDAELGRLVVDTDAPPAVTAPLAARLGDTVHFRASDGMRRLDIDLGLDALAHLGWFRPSAG